MTNENKRTWVLSTLVCLIPIIAGAALYGRLPEQIATHWDFNGVPNGWSPRFVGVFVLPGSLLVLNMLFPLLLKLDPKYRNLSGKVKGIVQWTIPAVALFASGVTLAAAAGADVKVEVIAPLFTGLVFVFVGNYLPKISQSYTVGIKLPWTLADEENWEKTHRFAGYLWVVCGVLTMGSAFLPVRHAASIALFLVMILVPAVYSCVLWKRKQS